MLEHLSAHTETREEVGGEGGGDPPVGLFAAVAGGAAEATADAVAEMVQTGFADGGDMTFGDDQRHDCSDESNERQVRADGKEQDGQHQAHDRGDGADDHGSARPDSAWFDVSAKTRVALELLFDLAQNSLFIF